MHVVASLRSEETVVSIKKQLALTIFYVSSKKTEFIYINLTVLVNEKNTTGILR